MEWYSLTEKKWYEAYKLAKDFYNAYGHLNVPYDYKAPNGYEIKVVINELHFSIGEGFIS